MILIEYKISETEMKIYGFHMNIHDTLTVDYAYYGHSRRNDENDIWGHMWEKHFHNKLLNERREFEDLHDYYPDGYGCNVLDVEYDKIYKKYNPVLNKTKDGFPYLSGQSAVFSLLPKIELSDEDLDYRIKLKLLSLVGNLKINK